MKIRKFLVSNSSSTSFIVSYKPGEICKCCGRKTIDIIEQLEHINFGTDDYEIHAQGVKNIRHEVNEIFCDEEIKQNILKKLDNIQDGFDVVMNFERIPD